MGIENEELGLGNTTLFKEMSFKPLDIYATHCGCSSPCSTHSYLLQGEEQPQCVGCNAPLTVRHFLLECVDFAQVRNNCFNVSNMKQLFQDIHIDSIMTFLRQINPFNMI